MGKSIVAYLFKFLPKAFLSRIFGWLARVRLPNGILQRIIAWYCKKFPVITDEIVYPENGFTTLDSFFTRSVIPESHPIDSNLHSVISPVDGRIDQWGPITAGDLIQAKGVSYRLADLFPSMMHHRYLDGNFMTIYLSPADYHRIHSPVTGKIAAALHFPGKLYTVQEFMVERLQGLFAINERVITHIITPHGYAAVCKIGAMNVGRISLSYCDIVSNASAFRSTRIITYDDDCMPGVQRGTELGTFHLGSTVVLLFSKGMVEFDAHNRGDRIRMGSRLGELF